MKKIAMLGLILFVGCATKKLQVNRNIKKEALSNSKQLSHTFYLIGESGENEVILNQFKKQISHENENTTALFLGNNAYSKCHNLERKEIFENQIASLSNFKGKALYIPGSFEWDEGLSALKKHQKKVENNLGKHAFSPQKGCPIDDVKINDDIVVITVDSEWYFEDWDKHPKINDRCEIKNRTAFFDEFESLIKKNIGKTIVVAIHRPLYSEGVYAGKSTFAQQLYPIPLLGHAVRKTSGVFSSDLQNKRYLQFKQRMVTLAQYNSKVVFVSGHEQSLQYLEEDNLAQIISGAGGLKTKATKLQKALFTYGNSGYAKLEVYTDGSSLVRFYSLANNSTLKEVFSHEVFEKDKIKTTKTYPSQFKSEYTSQVYSDQEVKSSKAQRFFWGKRYRAYYGTKVTAPTVTLDTLFGGLKPIRKGGGHQSKSLRLTTKNGKEYVMRAIRKSGTKYLQAIAFKDQYIAGQYDKTGVERLVLDVFTGSHPYAPFTIGTLSDAVGVYHTNPTLYYIPKQNALGDFNTDFGDELYMIEERTASGHDDLASFGNAKKIVSTDDLYKNLRKNSNYSVDQKSYIRARLFDMLIGDWDRHGDQWRWSEFEDETKKKYYKPIPRDRDQAFSIMDDGFFLGTATKLIPTVRLLRSYDETLKSPKWMNAEPFPLDVTLTAKSAEKEWLNQASYIQTHLTDETIDKAFAFFPDEIKDETIAEIKKKLQGRRKNLKSIAKKYYQHLSKYAIVTGTDTDDIFELERKPNGITTIKAFHSKKNKKGKLIFEKQYDHKYTREIWIYGLDDKDVFHVKGKGTRCIPIRIIGGQGNDTYTIENGKKVALYDFKSKKNTFTTKKGIIKLKDQYDTNIFDKSRIENNTNAITPLLGFNPDDGFKIGLSETYTINGFERNPFTQKHHIGGAYFFATKGFELEYASEFANIIGKFNLGLDASFQSPNYAINFFGFGNGTKNPEPDNDNLDLDFNRVKIQQFKFSPSLVYYGKLGSKFKIVTSYEIIKAEKTTNRFVAITNELNPNAFNEQQFLGSEVSYHFINKNHKSLPTLGIETSLKLGAKTNLEDTDRSFGYAIPSLALNYKLDHEGKFVLATKLKGHINFGDDFEFFQAASIGGNNGLRGFRNQRFTGKQAFYQNTDLRWQIKRFKTHVLPVNLGLFGGFDYGKVWSDFDLNNDLNTSYGGGFWINGAELFTARFGLFNSEDSSRFTFGIGFGF